LRILVTKRNALQGDETGIRKGKEERTPDAPSPARDPTAQTVGPDPDPERAGGDHQRGQEWESDVGSQRSIVRDGSADCKLSIRRLFAGPGMG